MEEVWLTKPTAGEPDMSDSLAVYVFSLGVIALVLIIIGSRILWRRLSIPPIVAWLLASAHGCFTVLIAWKMVWLTDFFTLGIVQSLLCLLTFLAVSVARKRPGPPLPLGVLIGAAMAGIGTVVFGYLMTWMTVSGVI